MEKSKRKSRYKFGRRRSRSLGGIISTEICKTIDNTLPPEIRLKYLVEYSLKNAFSIAERELSTDVDPDKYDEETSSCLNNINTDIERLGLYISAVSEKENTAETSIENILTQYNSAISKLEKESEQWDEIINTEREDLADTIDESSTPITYKGSLDSTGCEAMNYSEIMKDISYAAENYDFQLEKLKHINALIDGHRDITNAYTTHLNKESEEYLSKTIGTPRTLIKKFIQGN